IYCMRNRVTKKQKTNSNERGDEWVDLEIRLGWPRCAPAERPLRITVRVGLKNESDGRSGYMEASR
ncbi:MAG: hypothetical protein WAK55_31975, partial [Xanthobacteraceae bacterium]